MGVASLKNVIMVILILYDNLIIMDDSTLKYGSYHVHINILDTFVEDGGFQAHPADPYMAQAVK